MAFLSEAGINQRFANKGKFGACCALAAPVTQHVAHVYQVNGGCARFVAALARLHSVTVDDLESQRQTAICLRQCADGLV